MERKVIKFPTIILIFTFTLFFNTAYAVIGDPLPGLTSSELAFFNEGKRRFSQIDSVLGTEPGATPGSFGLGPRFNMNSCSGCHSQPAVGGSSPAINPQVAVATEFGANNIVPSFITLHGPVREARFITNADGTLDGGVHDLFVITGRQDAVGCHILQPDFNTAVANNNVIFRIPTPVFGGGLIETIEDSAILANMNSDAARKQAFGIGGTINKGSTFAAGILNRNVNDGTVTRFGWKAQNKSLMTFAGEAYNVEMGVTNEVFQTERDETPGCVFNGIPEDHTNFAATSTTAVISDVQGFEIFMRFLAPPQPVPSTPASIRGAALFSSIGCDLCHTPSFTTGPSSSNALDHKPVNLYSDLLVHHMGTGLADNVVQGLAGPDQFRTAPLWGISQRLFFLHDGRATDLKTAIQAHASTGSEANKIVGNFNNLFINQQSDIIAFLKTL